MKRHEMIWWGFVVLVVAFSFAHMIRSMYLSSMWEDCLDRWGSYKDGGKTADGQVMVIDKCNTVLRN